MLHKAKVKKTISKPIYEEDEYIVNLFQKHHNRDPKISKSEAEFIEVKENKIILKTPKEKQILQKKLDDLVNNEEFHDVQFSVKDREGHSKIVYGHKLILCSRCEYFRIMFSSGMIESQTQHVTIDNIYEDVFLSILKFIYTGDVCFNSENVMEVLAAANQFGLNSMKKKFKDYFEEILDENIACYVLEEAHFHQAKELFYTALRFIEDSAHKIFLEKKHLLLSSETMKLLLKSDYLSIGEYELCECVIEWAKSKGENFEKLSHSIIDKIRFPIMKPNELQELEKKYANIIPVDYFIEAYRHHVLGDINGPRTRHRISRKVFHFSKNCKTESIELTNSNLTAFNAHDEPAAQTCLANVEYSNRGRYYWEIRIDSCPTPSDIMIGVCNASTVKLNTFLSHNSKGWGWYAHNGSIYHNSYASNYTTGGYTQGDVIGVLLDFEKHGGSLGFFKNGVFMGIAYTNVTGPVSPAITLYHPMEKVTILHQRVKYQK